MTSFPNTIFANDFNIGQLLNLLTNCANVEYIDELTPRAFDRVRILARKNATVSEKI
jgi:hypothetical protein